MKDFDKIKLLEAILGDDELVSKKILREEEPEGKLIVEAEGDSPEEAKENMLETLGEVELPGEEEMEEMMPELPDMVEEEPELDEEMLDAEDREILDMLPEASREEFKKKLLEKIKSL